MYGVTIALLICRVNTSVYGCEMTRRLTVDDWLEHGLEVLGTHGFMALKADPMAKSLGVSRGSFYWHFSNLNDFHVRVLEHWRSNTTSQVIQSVSDASGDRLVRLVAQAFAADRKLERAVRSWAAAVNWVADAVDIVDDQRIDFIRKLLVDDGLPRRLAGPRAMLLYWGYLGRLLVRTPELPDRAMRDWVRMMQQA